VGSIEAIIPPARLRPWLIDAVARGMERELAGWTPPAYEPVAPRFERPHLLSSTAPRRPASEAFRRWRRTG
jgi:hypothetical protein